jgi:hypothetical protein
MTSLLDATNDDRTASFPTAAELDEITGKFQEAYNELENVAWKIARVTGDTAMPLLELDRPPSHEDLGLFFSFLADVEIDVQQMDRELDKLKEGLHELDGMRRERWVAIGRRLESVA